MTYFLIYLGIPLCQSRPARIIIVWSASLCLLTLLSCYSSCSFPTKDAQLYPAFDYGTQNDSALYYFNKGWMHIMDLGQWTESENSFRKAVQFDSEFLIGKSLVGRISNDLNERQSIYEELDNNRDQATKHEELLLNIFMSNINIMNMHDKNPELVAPLVSEHRALSMDNFRRFVHAFPSESYIKAEYIEIIHALQGAVQALDSIELLTSKEQKKLPFFISYRASLEAQLGKFDEALSNAEQLVHSVNDDAVPAPYALFAEIYFEMDSLELAREFIIKAIELDSNHLIAQGLHSTIEKKRSLFQKE